MTSRVIVLSLIGSQFPDSFRLECCRLCPKIFFASLLPNHRAHFRRKFISSAISLVVPHTQTASLSSHADGHSPPPTTDRCPLKFVSICRCRSLGSNAVWTCRCTLTFQTNVLSPYSERYYTKDQHGHLDRHQNLISLSIRKFRLSACVCLPGCCAVIEAASSYKRSVNICHTTLRNIPEGSNLHTRRIETPHTWRFLWLTLIPLLQVSFG